MRDYKRLTKKEGWHDAIDLKDEYGYKHIYQRLAELENKIENGMLIEVDNALIGECVIGIQGYTDGTYSLDLDENLVIGFANNGVVTWNNTHGFNDYFNNGLYFIDNEKGRAEAEARLKEIRGEV